MNDKQRAISNHNKLQRIQDIVRDLFRRRYDEVVQFANSDQPDKTELVQHNLDDLQKIKEILEPEHW